MMTVATIIDVEIGKKMDAIVTDCDKYAAGCEENKVLLQNTLRNTLNNIHSVKTCLGTCSAAIIFC